ncbi:hypothetical protein [Luteimonas huabeiensis]|uniref:hypothetical protein n=1 Tax=Luteimonas huabeiensis TaxID=1244513 RepID=UPI000462EAEA|nr:hypothetical protein [Luteimonas huabeiensis]
MSKFDALQDRALELAGHLGDNIRHAIPDHAGKWLQTGAALGAARAATRTAGRSITRHPAISGSVVVAVIAGAGLLWWASKRRKQKQAAGSGQTIEGSSHRVEARRAPRRSGARRGTRTTATAPRDADSAD